MGNRYGFPTEPNVRIWGMMGTFTDVPISEAMEFLSSMAKAMDDPWPFERNETVIDEVRRWEQA